MRIAVAAITLCLLAASATPQSRLPSQDSLHSIIRPWISTENAVGMVVGITDSRARQTAGVGRVVVQGSTVPSDSTVFEIGSISKVLTGTLLADMVLRGEVQLADPVRKYLPASVRIPARPGREITLLDLATHLGTPSRCGQFRGRYVRRDRGRVLCGRPYSFLSSYNLDRVF